MDDAQQLIQTFSNKQCQGIMTTSACRTVIFCLRCPSWHDITQGLITAELTAVMPHVGPATSGEVVCTAMITDTKDLKTERGSCASMSRSGCVLAEGSWLLEDWRRARLSCLTRGKWPSYLFPGTKQWITASFRQSSP